MSPWPNGRLSLLKQSHNHFDVRAMTGRVREWRVARDDGRIERLRQSHVHGVIRRHVLAQLPRSSQQIEVGVTVEIEVDQILDRVGSTGRRHLARSNESPKGLRHFDIDQMWRMKVVRVSKQTRLDPPAQRRLQEEFQQRRGIDHDHADSRSSRMTVATGVFSVTRFRPWILVSIS